MATRIRFNFPTLYDEEWRVDIDDADYAGDPLDVDVGADGFTLRYDGEIDSVNPGIVGSGCSVSILVTEDNEADIQTFATDLITSEESRFTMAIYKVVAGLDDALYWVGYLVPDLGAFDDIGSSYFFTVKAVDGLARLKSTEYKDTAPTPDAPYGSLSFLDHLVQCLTEVGTESYWGATDEWLRTVVNWQESGMPAPSAAIDPLKYSRVHGRVFAKEKNTDGNVSYEFFSCFKVVEALCLHWDARFMLSNGSWRFEQVRERLEETFHERRYDTTGALLSSTATAGYDKAVLQTIQGSRVRGGQFSYLPALKHVRVKYVHNTYVNQLQGQDYRWQKDSSYNQTFTVSGISYDSDSFFKVSGVLNVNISVTYTKPWRAVFSVMLRLPEQPYRLKSITSITQLTPNAPIYAINRTPPEWDDSGGGYYYEISTQVITSSNYNDAIPFSFWTPFIPAGEKGFEINFAGLIFGEKVDGDPQVLTLNDWSFQDLVLTISGLDVASNFEAERLYKAENNTVGNSDSVEIESIFGHAVKAWTPCKIEVTNNLTTWTNSTATWDRGTETNNKEFGDLLARSILGARILPVQTYSGSIRTYAMHAHSRVILVDDSAWLIVRGEFNARMNQWNVEMLDTGFDDGTNILSTTPTRFPLVGGSLPKLFGLVAMPGSGTGRMTSQTDRGRQALALLTGNYISTNISAGTVTTLPVDFPIKGNAYSDGDLIAVVDPQSGELIPFVVDGDQPAGATSIAVVSTTIDYDIPIGAQVVYSPMNLLTDEGGDNLPGMPPGTVQGEILRWNATNEVWEPYGAGSTDGHVLTWDSTNGFQAEAPASSGGTVTSVGLSMPAAIFDVSGSPVTTSGTITVSLDNQSANQVFSGPASGAAAAPTFRSLVSDDIPSLDAAKITTGTFGIARGGTGLSSLGTAMQLLRVNAGATALEYFTPSYLTGNQTITLSGDVSGSGATAITTTIGTNAVTDAKFRQSAGLSVVGRSANSIGNVADITAANDGEVLRRSGTTIGFGTVATAGIANDAVTYAKIQNVTDNRLLGRSAGSAGDVQEITIGSGLSLSSGTLSATGSGVTGSGVANRIAIWSGTSSLTSDDHPLYWDGTNNYLGLGTASPAARLHVAVPTGTNDEGLRILGNLSGNLNTTISNANNASSGSNNILNITTGGSNGGDPIIQLGISGATTWSVGLDNSDSDKFKISEGSTPGSSDRIIIASGGNVGIGTTVLTGRLNVAGSGTTSSTYSMLVNNNSATTIFSVRDDQRVGIMTTSPTQELHVNGDVIARQFMNTTAAPSVSFGTGAGTGPTTNSITGGVNFFTWQFTTGTSPAANGDIATFTLNQAFPSTPIVCFTPRSSSVANELSKFYISGAGTNAFTLKANGTLTASTLYQINFVLGGY